MKFSVEKENYSMTADVQVIGNDILIVLTGGDNPHVGAVTTLTADSDIQTIKYPSHDGRFHKDGVLGERIAKTIQPELPGSCTITSGIHVNHISKKQIMVSDSMAKDLGQQILDWLSKTDFNAAKPIYYSKDEQPK